MKQCDLLLYTTKYRKGGSKFKRAAETKFNQIRKKNREVFCKAVESKKEFLEAFQNLKDQGYTVQNFYFYGHSGMYGIMFGTKDWPEQFSPYEWKNMSLPVDSETKMYFYACRSGRWFAPFIARTLGVTAYGYHNYTTVSLAPRNFLWEGFGDKLCPMFIIACPGKKSHGMLASILKYLGFAKIEKISRYLPESKKVDTTYDKVSHLYESTFEDIQVRSDELVWLENKLKTIQPEKVLDIGCGNGSFLDKLSGHFSQGVGVDLSKGMLEQAKIKRGHNQKLSFKNIDGPSLPFEDNSFDVVMSTLAFRYLDWDPVMSEILRVLKPGGRFLVLDMVTAPVKATDMGLFVKSKLKHYQQRKSFPQYYEALRKLVTNPAWKKMLHYNPIRSEHEMKWYLESRFEGNKAEVINVGWKSRILAFDTGRVDSKQVEKLSYP